MRFTAALGTAGSLFVIVSPAGAGDILRGGAPAPGNRAPASSTASAAQAAQARANAKDALARTSQALQAVQNAQAAAQRSAAARARNAGADPNHPGLTLPDVPDGLGIGGLQVDPRVATDAALWSGADLPTQSSNGSGRVNVTVRQRSQQALLNWETFNVGRNTDLHFDQSAGGASVGQWIAFNQVNDPSGRPSQILGSITAPGQVYVINQNGIIFGAGSQVNVHALVASALPVNENLIRRGLLNQSSTAQFLFSALAQTGEDPFTPPPAPASGRVGDVTVQPGAVLSAPTSESNVGGRIALIGANVFNHGTITTPDGQTILAAGLQVGFNSHVSSDASLRGLDTYVGQVGDYAGTVVNAGLIDALRGSITLTGKDISQAGALASSTSVSLNGRIDLRAEYNAVANPSYDPVGSALPPFLYGGVSGANTGTVHFAPGSVTRVLPEWGSADKVVGTALALRSQVNARGNIIHLDSGGLIQAPSGDVNFTTGKWDYQGTTRDAAFVRDGGQIYLGRDSMINVAGTPDAVSPLSNHILTVSLRASELADSPLLRNSLFRGGDITVDLRKTGTYNGREWVGTPLANLTGYLGIIERTVDELTVSGGSIRLNSGGSVIAQPGSLLDVSAGWLNYTGGTVKTTRLLYGGRLIDIADATPDRLYAGIYTGRFVENHANWGISNTFRVPWMDGEHFEEGYLHGADAGTLGLAGASMALDGVLRGLAVSGPRQQAALAAGGSLELDFETQKLNPGSAIDPLVSPTPPLVTFGQGGQAPAGAFGVDDTGAPLPLRDDRVARVVLDPGLLALGEGGFSTLKVRNPDGDITVPAGVTLEAQPKGTITFEAANIRIHGDLIAPGGDLAFSTYTISPAVAEALKLAANSPLPAADPTRGQFVLGGGATLDAAGLVVDQRYADSPTLRTPLVTDGGSVSIRAYAASLASGSLIDVSGGALAGRSGISYGKAGSIEIITGQDPNLTSVDGGALQLGSTLLGYSGTGTGGSLTLQAQLIQIGGGRLHPLSLVLDPDFFNRGGFSTFNLTGIGAGAPAGSGQDFLPAVSVADGVTVRPQVLGWLGIPWSMREGGLELIPFLRPEGLRAPASVSLNGAGLRNELAGGAILYRGDVRIGQGAGIRTDALGSIRVTGETVAVYGSLIAPAGTITIDGGRSEVFGGTQLAAKTTVYLAPTARLSTAGAVLTQLDRFGRRTGSVLPGGTISVSGNILAERGAVLDVSGISGYLDAHPVSLGLDAFGNELLPGDRLVPYMSGVTMPLYQSLQRPVSLDSAGGSIRLTGREMLFTDATLLGHAGGPAAAGGSLSISSGRFHIPGADFNTAETNLVVTQSGSVIPSPFFGTGVNPIGSVVTDASGTILPGMGYFTADTFARGGFDSLSLGGNVEFRGPVRIAADNILRVATGGVIRADSPVDLFAHYASLGQAFVEPQLPGASPQIFTRTIAGILSTYNFAPTGGAGTLRVIADHLDVGTLSLDGIGHTVLTARGGDIRGNGTLQVAGSLRLSAAQIYPTTGSAFNILAYHDGSTPGSITIQGSGQADLPLSGGGSLNLFASEIVQGGVLRAPFGSIQLGWDGSGSAPFISPVAGNSVALPVTQTLTLAAGSQTSVAAVDPRTGQGVLIPYGYVKDGESWIAPNGEDISATGPPEKRITLAGQTVTTAPGSLVDIRGGGDLYGYQFVPGTGGSTDVLDSAASFAIIPGYSPDFSPYAPFNPAADTFGGDAGYRNNSLTAGDQIYLSANHGLPAGNYTLLPARYALLPGAWLISPQSGAPVGSFAKPDGSYIVSGYRHNDVDPGTDRVIQKRWELAPGSVVRERSRYEEFSGDQFFAAAAEALNIATPRLPEDSGRLILQATLGLDQQGNILGRALGGGRGALVDISSPLDIVIGEPGATAPAGSLLLTVSQLNTIGAESLLIGGIRTPGAGSSSITVNTGRLTLDNALTALTGSDVILVARDALTIADGARLLATGSSLAEALVFGDSAVAGSGNGLMVRASGDASASAERRGVTAGGTGLLTVGNGAVLGGASLALDSTAGTALSPGAILTAGTVNLSSGQVSIALGDPGALPAGNSLVLAGEALASLQQNAANLNLLSYTSLDLYGSGSLTTSGALRLSAGEIRGFGQAGGDFAISANVLTLDNRGDASVPGIISPASGRLVLNADRILLGSGDLRVDQFSAVDFTAGSGLEMSGTGSLFVERDVTGSVAALLAGDRANHALRAGGSLSLGALTNTAASAPALGGVVLLEGAGVNLGADVLFPSGAVTVRATSGDLTVGGRILAPGTAQRLNDLIRYTNGGEVTLAAAAGNVVLTPDSLVDVAAAVGGGNAGRLVLSAPAGTLTLGGTLRGAGNGTGLGGSAVVDVRELPALSATGTLLDAGGFLASRDYRVRTGDVVVDGTSRAGTFRLATDAGSITVSGTIDASGATGGEISLTASGSLTTLTGSRLSVAGEEFTSAGKGGSIRLEAGAQTNGVVTPGAVLDLQSGSRLDLGVAALVPGAQTTPGSSAFYGEFTGTLHLRAPQTAAGTDLALNPVLADIAGASSVLVEGYKLYDLTATDGTITSAVQSSVQNDGLGFGGAVDAMTARLLPGGAADPLASVFVIAPGAEIIHRTGDLTLGTPSTTATADWDLSGFRFGPKSAPGVLTLRAAGDLVFNNTLSDGFAGGSSLWLAPLMAQNPLLPANTQTWAYRLTAGADFSSAASGGALPAEALAEGKGSLLLGKNYGNANFVNGSNGLTSSALQNGNRYQVIRTGTGAIEIAAGRDVRLMNVFSSIYTAGTQVLTPDSLYTSGDFSLPVLDGSLNNVSTVLGRAQQSYPAQYALAGGSIRISAGADVARYTQNTSGELIDDASRQIPGNWLYRRGYVDPATGEYGVSGASQGSATISDPSASTTWWVDYSNFFQSIGALGGGDVTIAAGNDVRNVDAVAPTNARAPGGVPDASRLVELGGGNVSVTAGADILGGTYYVERGTGTLSAGGSITLESTTVGNVAEYNPRSPSLGILANLNSPEVTDPSSWIPTMLFLGRGGYDIAARGDVLLGPVANTFLAPSGIGNKYWYKTWFSTYGADSYVNVRSLSGDVTHRLSVNLPEYTAPFPALQAWLLTQNQFSTQLPTNGIASNRQPWLRLSDSSATQYGSAVSLMPGTLRSTALAGDIRIVGDMTLSPSPTGTLEIAAAGNVSGLNPAGVSGILVAGSQTRVWTAATVNLSDADPDSIPGITNPLTYHTFADLNASTGLPAATATARGDALIFTQFDTLFAESGSYQGRFGVSQIKQALHDSGILHLGDPEPLRLYALGGDISGLTLFSPKASRILAGQDLTDLSLYLQNVRDDDFSIVTAGRDILPYNPNSPLRSLASASGSLLAAGEPVLAGDLQIGGPGTLEILAGRRLTLGSTPAQADGTGDGISSIGNLRNPFLPTDGANLVLAAGIGSATSLNDSGLDFEAFISQYVQGGEGQTYLAELGITDFESRPAEEQARIALEVFYKVLRDAGRGFSATGSYASGTAAIDVLFGGLNAEGDINLSSRSLKTRNGGSISVVAPGGGLTLGTNLGNSTVPPGIITESGGNISLFTRDSVDVGVLRIFTLRGGNIVIWSSEGDVAAGSSSKTVAAAPPTRVIIDPQSADVATDLAGLATGGGIGVLATVKNVEPGDVDLIAPQGAVDAGDAGIRSAGNLTIAASQVLNAGNIAVGGLSTGAPSAAVSAPSVPTAAPPPPPQPQQKPSGADSPPPGTDTKAITDTVTSTSEITVQVIGYGGGSGDEEDDEEKRRREKAAEEDAASGDGN